MDQPAAAVLKAAYELLGSKHDNLLEDGGRGLLQEYRDVIALDVLASCRAAERKQNAPKNRYGNVLPFDYNRVKLSCKDDYINASLLQSESAEAPAWSYIATQGPMPGTTADFWRMVCENKCRAILMLTKTVEHRSVKCYDYFPVKLGSTTECGAFAVTASSQEDITDDITRRTLSVLDKESKEVHTVSHYHYHQWSDHGVPDETLSLRVLSKVLEETNAHDSSIVVHCSAGVGRTGTFCTVDIVLRAVRYLMQQQQLPTPQQLTSLMDIFSVVKRLRRQRRGMVQTLDQYYFCYQTVLEELEDMVQQAAKAKPQASTERSVDKSSIAQQQDEQGKQGSKEADKDTASSK